MKSSILKSLLFALIGVTFLACSSTDDDLSPPSDDSTLSTVTLKSSVDQSRITDLDSPSFAESVTPRSQEMSVFISPTIPDDAESIVGKDMSYGVLSGSSYYLPAGESFDGQLMFDSNVSYYIAGDLTLNYWNTWGATGGIIYVLDGGSITVSGSQEYITICNWGEVIFNGDFEVSADGGSFFNYGVLELNTNSNKLTIRGDFYSASEVVAGSILTSGDREIIFASCVTAEHDFCAENYATVYLAKGLESESVTLDSYAHIYLRENTLVSTGTMIYNNDSRFINESSEGYAVISIEDELIIHNNTYFERMSGGEIRLHCDEDKITPDASGLAIQWSASVVINASDTYIPANYTCFGGFGEGDASTEDDEITLEHVTKVESPDYERISATSIDFKDGYAFVSWHEREEYYQGYIDVIDMTTLQILATYYTTELDFNHIYVAPSDIYVAGGSKNGAFYSAIDYSLSSSSVEIEINSVEGASGNCILQENGYNWIVSGAVGGVTRSNGVDEDIFTSLEEAKFVAKYGDNMAVLAGVSPADAKVYEYNIETGAYVKDYTVGTIPTVDGKNTLFVDGDDIYVALGEGGLKIFNNGVEKNSFDNVTGSGSVNCVYVDEDYIYIANGVAGLYILDKNSLDVLKTYQLGETSANYVKVGDNGLIYVAYGLDGVHVFKLKD